MPSFESTAVVTGTVTINHASTDILAPGYKLKCHNRRAPKSSDHPSDLVAAPAPPRSMPADRSISMSSSFIEDEVLARELADADVFTFLSSRNQLALCPTELVKHRLPEESDLTRILTSIQRTMRCLSQTLHFEPCEQPSSVACGTALASI